MISPVKKHLSVLEENIRTYLYLEFLRNFLKKLYLCGDMKNRYEIEGSQGRKKWEKIFQVERIACIKALELIKASLL